MKTGVYQIRNLINDKRYIGSSASKGFANRWNLHRKQLDEKIHHNRYLQRAWHKYGADAFVFEILEECQPERCIEREQHYLDVLLFASCNDDRFNELGYNIARRADSCRGVKWTEERRQRCSGENHPMYGRCGKYNPRYGTKHTKETKRKMSEAQRGRVMSETAKQKVGEATKQRLQDPKNHPMYGKTHTKEAREKISRAGRGRKPSAECRKRLSEVHRGSQNINSRLDEEKVKAIKLLIHGGEKTSTIARQFDVSQSTICDIKAGRTWSYLDD